MTKSQSLDTSPFSLRWQTHPPVLSLMTSSPWMQLTKRAGNSTEVCILFLCNYLSNLGFSFSPVRSFEELWYRFDSRLQSWAFSTSKWGKFRPCSCFVTRSWRCPVNGHGRRGRSGQGPSQVETGWERKAWPGGRLWIRDVWKGQHHSEQLQNPNNYLPLFPQVYKFDSGTAEIVYVLCRDNRSCLTISKYCLSFLRWPPHVIDWLFPSYDQYSPWRSYLSSGTKIDDCFMPS